MFAPMFLVIALLFLRGAAHVFRTDECSMLISIWLLFRYLWFLKTEEDPIANL